jgi:hypothetical protein
MNSLFYEHEQKDVTEKSNELLAATRAIILNNEILKLYN